MRFKKIAYYTYKVSEEGLVVSIKTGKILKYIIINRQCKVHLHKKNKEKLYCVSHIVYKAFKYRSYMGGIKAGKEIHHNDLNIKNNRLDNLQMLSKKQHKILHNNIKYEKIRNL